MTGAGVRQVWSPLTPRVTAGDELELIRPSIYRNVARQLNISLHSESVVTDAFLAVAAQIFAAGTSASSPGSQQCLCGSGVRAGAGAVLLSW